MSKLNVPFYKILYFFSLICSEKLFFDGKLLQVIHGAVVGIEVHVSVDAAYASAVSVLPKFPLPFILQRVDIVMRYPVGVVVEYPGVKKLFAEFMVGV